MNLTFSNQLKNLKNLICNIDLKYLVTVVINVCKLNIQKCKLVLPSRYPRLVCVIFTQTSRFPEARTPSNRDANKASLKIKRYFKLKTRQKIVKYKEISHKKSIYIYQYTNKYFLIDFQSKFFTFKHVEEVSEYLLLDILPFCRLICSNSSFHVFYTELLWVVIVSNYCKYLK